LRAGTYFGIENRACAVGSFLLTEYQYDAKAVFRKHSHERTYVSFVLNGFWHESYGAKSRERIPHSLSRHPAGEIHSERIGPTRASAFQVEFADDWLRSLGKHASVLAEPSQIESGPAIWLTSRLYAEFQRVDAHSPLIIEGLILESIGQLSRKSIPGGQPVLPSWLSRVRDILHARFAEQLSIRTITAEVGIHPVHLSRTFRRHFGRSIGSYLRELRIERACQDLIASDRPLADVAIAAGFCDQSHLCRILRQRTGLTPTAFRATRRRLK
jgi:AraC family transcriptional regulator